MEPPAATNSAQYQSTGRRALPKKTFETMNGLRGLAALIIVIYHGASGWGILRPSRSYLAVDLFFVLSGFVIAHSYQARFASGMTIKQFFVVRIVRLYPLYFVGTMISCVILMGSFIWRGQLTEATAGNMHSLPFAFAMLPTPSFDRSAVLYPLNSPAWSLFLEIIVNLTYAASYKLWSTKNILITMSIAAALMLSNDWFAVAAEWGAWGFTWASLPFGLLRVFYSFPAGVLIYRIVYERNLLLPHFNSIAILVIFPLLLVWPHDWACKIVMLVGIPLLVALAAKSEPEGIVRSLCAALGSASYAIYAIHIPLIWLTAETLGKFGVGNSQIVGYIFLIAIVPISLLIDKWFDTPARRVLSHIFVPPIPYEPARSTISTPIATLRNPRGD